MSSLSSANESQDILGLPLELAERVANGIIGLGILCMFQWWSDSLYLVGVAIALLGVGLTVYTMSLTQADNAKIIDQLANLAFFVGIFAVVQWWRNDLYWVGRGLIIIGVVGIVTSLVLTRTELAQILDRAGMLLLIIGGYAVFQWQRESDYIAGRYLVGAGLIAYALGMILARTHPLKLIERLLVVGMALGMVGMFQSWDILYYEYGFYVLGLATLGFIVVSHIPMPEDI